MCFQIFFSKLKKIYIITIQAIIQQLSNPKLFDEICGFKLFKSQIRYIHKIYIYNNVYEYD